MTVARREALLAGAAIVSSVHILARPTKSSREFLWDVATPGHQIKGNNVNSYYGVMEHISKIYCKEKSGDACDSWDRWLEHFALIKPAGLNAYRCSVAWPRIEPEPGESSQATLA